VIEAVLFDGDQTLWDFERVMREALVAVAGELRAARPGAFADALRWEDLQADRAFVAEAMPEVWSLAELRVHGFAARWRAGATSRVVTRPRTRCWPAR
jgi:phosphoglycolate phosphatase-like HAD superfamily hydrolase